jgi:aspartate/methionine/tyrosine aminotransferase
MLSKRVQGTLKPSPLFEGFRRALSNAYDKKTNPNGIISLGIAENTLMYSDVANFLTGNLNVTENLFGYSSVAMGLPSLLDGLVDLFNSSTFSPVVPVKREHLYFSSGSSAVLDQCFYSLADAGDGVLIGKPMYGGFVHDLSLRAHLTLLPVSLKGFDPFGKEAVTRFEEEYIRSRERGINVRILVLCTPHNPLGQYFLVVWG